MAPPATAAPQGPKVPKGQKCRSTKSHLHVLVVSVLQLLLQHLARDAHDRAEECAYERRERLSLEVRHPYRCQRHEASLVSARPDSVARKRSRTCRNDAAVDSPTAHRSSVLKCAADGGTRDGLDARFDGVEGVQEERRDAGGEAPREGGLD